MTNSNFYLLIVCFLPDSVASHLHMVRGRMDGSIELEMSVEVLDFSVQFSLLIDTSCPDKASP